MNLQLKLLLASVERAVRATLRRERSWALVLSGQCRLHSPQAQAREARELLARVELESPIDCWHASDRGMTARGLLRPPADVLRPLFRAIRAARASYLKYCHLKK